MSDEGGIGGRVSQGSHYRVGAMKATGVWAVRRRLASAMRRVIDRLLVIDAPEDELEAAAEALERYGDRLARHPLSARYESHHETATAGNTGAFLDQSPLIGLSNPLAPPIELVADGDVVHGSVVFGNAYEGPPGCVHGGFVAAAFDEVLGFAQSLTGSPGMTGTLTVIYRRPTPLETPLRFEARTDRVEGRKIFASSEVYAGDSLTAEAQGIFISMRPDRFGELLDARAKRKAAQES